MIRHLGEQAEFVKRPSALKNYEKAIIPGVGRFGEAMRRLCADRWDEALSEERDRGIWILGICLGMQLLFEDSQEDAPSPGEPVRGLAILPGHVVRFAGPRFDCPGSSTGAGSSPCRLKVPHMGWNSIAWTRTDPLLRGVAQNAAVYFVHSYYPVSDETRGDPIVSATTDHGGAFCASVWRDNIWATQFHPEKSQRVGLKMLENFLSL